MVTPRLWKRTTTTGDDYVPVVVSIILGGETSRYYIRNLQRPASQGRSRFLIQCSFAFPNEQFVARYKYFVHYNYQVLRSTSKVHHQTLFNKINTCSEHMYEVLTTIRGTNVLRTVYPPEKTASSANIINVYPLPPNASRFLF